MASENKVGNLIFDYSDKPPIKASDVKSFAAPAKKVTDKTLLISIIVLLLVFGLMFGYFYWKNNQRALTIEELHQLNIQGKLKPEQGFLYKNAYSFVRPSTLNYANTNSGVADFWHMSLLSQSGSAQFNFVFRYSPLDVQNIPVSGELNTSLFNNATQYFITFDPTRTDLSPVILAINDYNQHMLEVFKKYPIAACDRNETSACQNRPIINCDNTKEVVVYMQQTSPSGVEFNGNCIIARGEGLELVKSVDRLLYTFYDIME